MNDKFLIDNGFTEFRPNRFNSDGVEKCFQKRYDNKIGKKYFITINKWKEMKHPYTGEVWGPSYEFTTQLYKKDTHEAVDILFHSNWKLEDVEEYLSFLFDTGRFDYYEKFFEEDENVEPLKLNKEEFEEKYCKLCGTQRCEGVDSDWFDGCKYKDSLKV